MKNITWIGGVILTLGFISCGSSALNKEESAQFYRECTTKSEQYAGGDKINMIMPDYKNKCKCYLNDVIEAETPSEEAMKLLEDKATVFANLCDLDCN